MKTQSIPLAGVALALALTGCTQTAGSGASSGITVPAGRTTTIDEVSVLNPQTCQNQRLPKTTVVDPANGSVAISPVNATVQPSAGVRLRKCVGTRARGLSVRYTPRPGFRGTDSFTVRYSFEKRPGARNTTNRTYRVNVQ